MIEPNIKVTILKNDGISLNFLAEADFNADSSIYTDIPIDENSEFIDESECFNCDDEAEPFYSTSINDLIEKYKSITLQEIKIVNLKQEQ
jgi:hypothetical protein